MLHSVFVIIFVLQTLSSIIDIRRIPQISRSLCTDTTNKSTGLITYSEKYFDFKQTQVL